MPHQASDTKKMIDSECAVNLASLDLHNRRQPLGPCLGSKFHADWPSINEQECNGLAWSPTVYLRVWAARTPTSYRQQSSRIDVLAVMSLLVCLGQGKGACSSLVYKVNE